jgi:hypothetical protein
LLIDAAMDFSFAPERFKKYCVAARYAALRRAFAKFASKISEADIRALDLVLCII